MTSKTYIHTQNLRILEFKQTTIQKSRITYTLFAYTLTQGLRGWAMQEYRPRGLITRVNASRAERMP